MHILKAYEHKKHLYFVNTCRKPWFAKYSQMLLANGRNVEYLAHCHEKADNMLCSIFKIISSFHFAQFLESILKCIQQLISLPIIYEGKTFRLDL